MTDEQKILSAYRASDVRGKRSILEYALSTAEDWPMMSEHGLVDASIINAGRFASGQLEDVEAPSIIGTAK